MSDVDVEALSAVLADRLRPGPEPALVDATAAGRLLAVPPSWLLQEARADRVPHVKLGRYVRFNPGEIRAWADDRTRGPRAKGRTT